MYNLVKSLKKNRVPIHGIGVQGHLIVGSVPTTIEENLRKFATLGVEVAITELDIRMELPATKEKLEQQRKDYMTVIGACKAVPACIGVTIWDWTDKVGIHNSWILRAVLLTNFLSTLGFQTFSLVRALLCPGTRNTTGSLPSSVSSRVS